ncbi:uncharacterized protein LOC113583249 [Electrophorus electricus]|uniref:uncharacterized protein LOC113583249 n=1 Tax=Electrophorus electricus TaxID=8005 RepID=UPI0015CFB7B9|nr:uncharacterized protein LOC113583249 [Electrophorus electricus]
MALRGVYCILALQACVGVCFCEEVLLPKSYNEAVNDKVLFTPIKLPSQPFDEVIWAFGLTRIILFSGTQTFIDSNYTNRASLKTTSFAMELRNLDMTDAGEYKITIKKKENSLFETTTLNVFEPVSNITITPRETELVEFNSTASLTCSASGTSISFFWLNGSSELTLGERVQLTNGNTTLIITCVSRDDIGPYRCGAFNIISKDMSQNMTLTIYYGPDKATVAAAPVGPFYSSGCDIMLRCSAEASPAAVFQWVVSGTVLGEKGPELKLANIQTNQSGSYTCLAHNTKSLRYSTSQPINIIVVEKISQVTLNDSTGLLIEGRSFSNLTCEGSGTILSTEWMKDYQILSPSNSVIFSPDNKTVLIGPVRRSDSGEYQCTLSNPVSSDTAKFIMTVNYGPDKVVIGGPSEVEVQAKALTFECITESIPTASYTWEFNGTNTGVTTVSFIVELVHFENSGKYTCIAQNHVTKLNASGSHALVVKEKVSGGDGTLSAGIIAAIVIGVLLVVTAVAGLVVYFTKFKGRQVYCSKRNRIKPSICIFAIRNKVVWLNSSSRAHKNIGATGNGKHELTYTDIKHFQNNQTMVNMGGTNAQMQHETLAMVRALILSQHNQGSSSIVMKYKMVSSLISNFGKYCKDWHQAESGWNPTALMDAFHQGLSEELKDELAHQNTSTSLYILIDLVLRIDSRIRERRRARGPDVSQGSCGAPRTLSPVHVPDKQGDSGLRPMQLGHTRLSRRAAGNFLNSGLANKLALPLVPLDEPLSIAAIDGQSLEPGVVSHPTHPVIFDIILAEPRLSPAKKNYDVGYHELLVVKLALEEWRHWLEGAKHPFLLWTDHMNLLYSRPSDIICARPDGDCSLPGLPPLRGNMVILVVVYRPFLCTAKTAIGEGDKVLLTQVVRLHGLPSDIVSEHGPQLISHFCRAFCRLLGAEASLSSGFHPQSNDQTERVNQDLERTLRCLASSCPSSWSEHLLWADFAHNTLWHSSLVMSPFACQYGYAVLYGFMQYWTVIVTCIVTDKDQKYHVSSIRWVTVIIGYVIVTPTGPNQVELGVESQFICDAKEEGTKIHWTPSEIGQTQVYTCIALNPEAGKLGQMSKSVTVIEALPRPIASDFNAFRC